MNTQELQTQRGYKAILDLMFKDGFGPDEVLAHAEDYARELTGHVTPTAIMIVKRHARSTMRKVNG